MSGSRLILDDLKLQDARDFIDLRTKHDTEFTKYCSSNPNAGVDDELDDHFDYLKNCFQFFFTRGYIK